MSSSFACSSSNQPIGSARRAAGAATPSTLCLVKPHLLRRAVTADVLEAVEAAGFEVACVEAFVLDLAPATSLGAHEFNDPIVLTPSVSRVPLKQLLELLQEMRREPEGGAALVDENAVQNLFFQPPPSSPAGSAGDEAAPPAAAHPPA